MINLESKNKIFQDCQFYIEEDFSVNKINLTKCLFMKGTLPMALCNFIDSNPIVKMFLSNNGLSTTAVLSKTLTPSYDFFINVRDENREILIGKIKFNVNNTSDLFNIIESKHKNIEFCLETGWQYPLDVVCLKFNTSDDEVSIKTKNVYIKQSENEESSKMFTFEDYLNNKEQVLNSLKLLGY